MHFDSQTCLIAPMPEPTDPYHLDGRTFVLTANPGVMGTGGAFQFSERDGCIRASYDGGEAVFGALVGVRTAPDRFRFLFQEVLRDGRLVRGEGTSVITRPTPGGPLVLTDVWRYCEGAVGEGVAVLEER